jgi:Mce-associated membrane protein
VTAHPVEELQEDSTEPCRSPGDELVDMTPDAPRKNRDRWGRVIGYVALPVIALGLALGAGFLRWEDSSARDAVTAATGSVAAARDSTAALLSYQWTTVDKDLDAARGRLTGSFRDQYSKLISDVVIPGSKQKNISVVATVPSAGSVSASESHAVVIVFVDQKTTIGNAAPADSSSSVRVTLDKIADRWLISGFEPI